MTDTPTPEAVEPMTPIRALATLRRWGDYLRAENSVLHTRAGPVISADVIDTVLSVAAKAHSRALPAPRRYTGGPLEDGLYLWREDAWREGYWESREVVPDLMQRPFWFRHSAGPIWLIGPISIPPIPESEEASS